MRNLFSVEGKVALVTGGSRGIGEMIARGYVENGAKVYISSRKANVCDGLAEELSKFPEVKRDLALLIDKRVTFSELRDAAFAAERKLLRSVSLFDVYEGDKLPKGKKSYALAFTLQDPARTLTDDIVEKAMGRIRQALEKGVGAELRG